MLLVGWLVLIAFSHPLSLIRDWGGEIEIAIEIENGNENERVGKKSQNPKIKVSDYALILTVRFCIMVIIHAICLLLLYHTHVS